ncbi:branched-chain amino acid ABC transporter permease [Salinigranum sp. GCM10025319]|uniref:branched-chain amino acid ABC transporter permease n=1 Tax=Salinigranum sp. GCM10025319 TaxID=3252687 RepID=UPI00360BCFAC
MSTDTDTESKETVADGDAQLLSWETWDRIKHTERFTLVAAIVFVTVFPTLFTNPPFIPSELTGYEALARLVLIWGIFALGFNLLLGQTGLLSFGHAMFWGVAAYGSGLVAVHFTGSPLLMILAGTVFAGIVAALTAPILLRLHTVYFSIMTLAIAQMLFFLAREPFREITGGINGVTGISVDPLLGMFELTSPLPGILDVFWYDHLHLLLSIAFVGVIVFLARVRKSPYGLLFKAIRENETRASFVGLNVWRYKFAAFLLSGLVVGFAGSLMPIEQLFTGVGKLHWETSGFIVMITVLGGLGTLVGPIVGVFIFLYFRQIVNGLPVIGSWWLLLLAFAFTAIVWRYPDGAWGMVTNATARLRSIGGESR